MLTLTDLLTGPGSAPEGLRPQMPGAAVVPPMGGFAATLQAAQTASGQDQATPDYPIPRPVSAAVPDGDRLEEAGEQVMDTTAPAPPAFGEQFHVPRAPLTTAISMVSREGTGQGSPGGNGLPLPGSDGGKTLPDVPPVRLPSTAPTATGEALARYVQRTTAPALPEKGGATGTVSAAAGSPGEPPVMAASSDAGPAVAVPAAGKPTTGAPAAGLAAGSMPAGSVAGASVAAAVVPAAVVPAATAAAVSTSIAAAAASPSAMVEPTVAPAGRGADGGNPASTADPTVAALVAGAARPVSRPPAVEAERTAFRAPAQAGTREVSIRQGNAPAGAPADSGSAVANRAATVPSTAVPSPLAEAAGHGARSTGTTAGSADSGAVTPGNPAPVQRNSGVEATAAPSERALLSQLQIQTSIQGHVEDGAALRRETGASEARLPGQPAAMARGLRTVPQDSLLTGGAMRPEQARPSGRMDVAAAGVFDRRQIAETAGQRRSGDSTTPKADEPDRTPATGTESGDQASRPQTARPVVPVLAARDLSALAERIEMMVHRRGGVANLNLSLSELGDVEISVRIESRQAHVQFLVHDAAAREALEAQLPRLRAMFGDGGLDLGDVGTGLRDGTEGGASSRGGESSSSDGGGSGSGDAGAAGRARAGLIAADETASQRPSGAGSRLLDAFA